ncbi:MAG: hypothetical protein HXS41_12400 [Theionarchaea archaeon]|nr:hypothetical protein [Theionarchaea archaeon]MBU7002022.1 hypothetical protein [Theionarchaea archaeon]MBU7021853.1 hypothetical protein [Theionarchaea archaeon]MBU7036030.1 hypothetical protein [Theionarchaea archaeon]MBU7040904.1 hypothetical protein [Theionarchaea archaeon]
MQAVIALIGIATRLILSAGLIYVLLKIGKVLDVLPDILSKKYASENK